MPLRYWLLIITLPALTACSRGSNSGASSEEWQGTTIVIGLDGLRWDYVDKFDLTTLNALGRRGVRANSLVPVFPTKTFPNFYALATGLYPNHSGILENTMYDPTLNARFRMSDTAAVRNAKWWEGEPIWVTAEKQGVRTAVFFWPGSEAAVEGVRPTYWRAYDGSIEGSDRIEQVLRWLTEPPDERPHLVMVYFSNLDNAGHRYGPDAPETAKAAHQVDDLIRALQTGLERQGLLDQVNLVIVSDHGMAQRSADHVIFLDDYVDVRSAGVLSLGEHMTLWPKPEAVDSVYLALADAHPALEVYKRDNLPPRFHLAGHRRTPPIVAVAATGWTVSTHDWVDEHAGRFTGGAHGYDNAEPKMHGFFEAVGPAFRAHVRIDTLEAVDVYNLLAASLDLQPAPNDGDSSLIPRLMKQPAN